MERWSSPSWRRRRWQCRSSWWRRRRVAASTRASSSSGGTGHHGAGREPRRVQHQRLAASGGGPGDPQRGVAAGLHHHEQAAARPQPATHGECVSDEHQPADRRLQDQPQGGLVGRHAITADDFIYNWQAQSGNPAYTDVGGQPYDAASTAGYNRWQSRLWWASTPSGGAACDPGTSADRNVGLCPNGSPSR